MAQRPMVRPDSAETRAKDQPPPISETKLSQRTQVVEGSSYPATPNTALDEILKLVAEQACLATSASACAIALMEDGAMVCRATAGPHAPEPGITLNTDSGLTGACVHTGQVQYCEDTETDTRVNAEACRRLQVRSVLVLPLHTNGELLGIIEIFSPFEKAFAPHDLDNLEALSRAVLENIRPTAASPDPAVPQLDEQSIVISEPWEEPAKAIEPSTPLLELSAIRWEPPEAESVVAPPVYEAPPPPPPAVPAVAKAGVAKPEAPKPEVAKQRFEPVRDVRTAPVTSRYTSPNTSPIDDLLDAPLPPVAPPAPPVRERRKAAAAVARPPQPPQLPQPAYEPQPPMMRADQFMAAQKMAPPAPPHRDWTTGVLTATVIAVALLLGWILGRAGWQHLLGGDTASPVVAAASTRSAEPHAADPDASAILPGAPVKPAPTQNPARSPFQPPPAKHNESNDGSLVVYEGGKIIFQQTARRSGANGSDADGGEPSAERVAGDPVSLTPEEASVYLLHRVEPIYPEDARLGNVSGEVHLEAVVGKDGTVQVLRLMSGNSQLAQAAADAVRQWRFKPYKSAGKAQEFRTRLTVTFRLH